MKIYGLYFALLALVAIFSVLAACGNGEVVDLAQGTEEYIKMNDVKENLTAGGGLIFVCKEEGLEKCESFYYVPESSSSSEEPPKEESSSSSSENLELQSSSSEYIKEPESSSSSSVFNPASYVIPEFTCSWTPDKVSNGGSAKVNISFNSSNAAAETDCVKKAWYGVDSLNSFLQPSGKIDTAFFELGVNITASGKITGKNGSTKDWPKDGATLVAKGTVSCSNASAGKIANSKTQDCAPLQVGTPPSSSSKPSSSSAAPSSSRSSSSATTPSSSATTPSSSSAGSGTCSGNMCLWNGAGACWAVSGSDVAKCAKDGWLFQGGEEGAATMCKGGTFVQGCGKDNSPPTAAASSKGCCRWNKGSQCWDVYSDKEVSDCNNTDHQYWTQSCPDKDGGCPK